MRGYIPQRLLGSGAFGSVYLVQQKFSQELLALKKIKKSRTLSDSISFEIAAGMLDHPNIVKIRDHYEDESSAYIAFEYLSESDLFNFIEERDFEPLEEINCRIIFKQLAEAVSYSHEQGFLHLDIKLENIMLNRETLKPTLIDFGLGQRIDPINGDRVTRRCGSEQYMAPEINFYSRKINVSGEKLDSWCLGVVLFAMLTAEFPFTPSERFSMSHNLSTSEPQLNFPFPISAMAKDLIEKLLCFDPETRMSAKDILSHPWIIEPNENKICK